MVPCRPTGCSGRIRPEMEILLVLYLAESASKPYRRGRFRCDLLTDHGGASHTLEKKNLLLFLLTTSPRENKEIRAARPTCLGPLGHISAALRSRYWKPRQVCLICSDECKVEWTCCCRIETEAVLPRRSEIRRSSTRVFNYLIGGSGRWSWLQINQSWSSMRLYLSQ